MGKKDARVDRYIAKSADFSKPILTHLRKLVHQACPDVEETMKWKMPSFEYKGSMCGMAAFQKDCAFIFWKSKLLRDPHNVLESSEKTAMGNLGRIMSLRDLPSDKIISGLLREARRLNDKDVTLSTKSRSKKKLTLPKYLLTPLRKNKKAPAAFQSFSYSNKKDYLEWITEAKTEETRQKRLETAIQWMEQGS